MESVELLRVCGSVAGLVVVSRIGVVKDGIGSEIGVTSETSILRDDEVGEDANKNVLRRIGGRRIKAVELLMSSGIHGNGDKKEEVLSRI